MSAYSDLRERLSTSTQDQVFAFLSLVLDRVYEARSAFAYSSTLLSGALELKTIPKSRRPFIEKQRDLFTLAARGEGVQVWTDRNGSAFNGISRFEGEDVLPPIPAPLRPDPASERMVEAAVAAARELRCLSAVAGYDEGVALAHTFTKVPAALSRAVDSIRDALLIVQSQSAALALPSDIDRKLYLREVGAKTTLTTSDYVDSAATA